MNVRERPVDEVIQELGLPVETKYLGYVVILILEVKPLSLYVPSFSVL